MKTVTTRELLTNHKGVQASLGAGESVTWTSRGRVVAQITPPITSKPAKASRPDWVARAKKAGAVNLGNKPLASWVSEDRGE